MLNQNEPLSERETEILRLVATGASNKEIAQQLVISLNTVKVHLRNIFGKIGVTSRTGATLYAIQNGLVNPASVKDDPDAEKDEALDVAVENDLVTTVAPVIPVPPITGEAVFAYPMPVGTQVDIDLPTEPNPAQKIPRARLVLRIVLLTCLALLLVAVGIWSSQWFFPSRPVAIAVASTEQSAVKQPSRWIAHQSIPNARKGMANVAYENGFFLIGGETARGIDGAVWQYLPGEDIWEEKAAKPTPVTDVQAVFIGEKIYIPGGLGADGKPKDILEVYNPRLNKWENKAKLPEARYGYALATVDGLLYLFGGNDGQKARADVFIYSPQDNRWQKGQPMHTARQYMGSAVDNGKIYVMGGYDGQHALDLNEAYYPSRDAASENAWETRKPLPEGRYAVGVTNLAGFIYLLGGISDSEQVSGHFNLQYSPQNDQWGAFEDPPENVGAYFAVVPYGGMLHVFGGETADGYSNRYLTYQAIYTISIPFIQDSPGITPTP